MSSDKPNQKGPRKSLKRLGGGLLAAFHPTPPRPLHLSVSQSLVPRSDIPRPEPSNALGPLDITSAHAGSKVPDNPPASSQAPFNTSNLLSGIYHQANNTVLVGLKGSLKALRQYANFVPPLKPVVDVLIDCIDFIPETTERQKVYKQLASDITLTAQGLEKHLSQLGPRDMPETVARVVG
ncbi:hypothetical protein FRC07_009413, partial [Ceratobasidium sp. 392]